MNQGITQIRILQNQESQRVDRASDEFEEEGEVQILVDFVFGVLLQTCLQKSHRFFSYCSISNLDHSGGKILQFHVLSVHEKIEDIRKRDEFDAIVLVQSFQCRWWHLQLFECSQFTLLLLLFLTLAFVCFLTLST